MIVYKNDYVEDERLFSTGNDELDEILEEVYYSGIEDGYDYAQREFSLNERIEHEVQKSKRLRDLAFDIEEEIKSRTGGLFRRPEGANIPDNYFDLKERLIKIEDLQSKSEKKLENLRKMKAARPWVIGGTVATGAAIAGVRAHNKKKKAKEKK